jgi:hypothetical protein
MLLVLWQSMEADERKHEALLAAMLDHGLPAVAEVRRPRKASPRPRR